MVGNQAMWKSTVIQKYLIILCWNINLSADRVIGQSMNITKEVFRILHNTVIPLIAEN